MNVNLEPQDLERIAEAVAGRLGDGMQRTRWLTAKEAAAHLRCSVRHLERLVALGDVAAYRPGGKRLFLVTELDAFVHQTKES